MVFRKTLFGFAALALFLGLSSLAGSGQTPEVKEKTPMYSYVSDWVIPRAQWAEMDKANEADRDALNKAMSDGTLVGWGYDTNLVHTVDGPTHDEWWSATSLAGVLKVLDVFYKNGGATAPVLSTSTKHWDNIYVSRYYNWHPGSWKDAYTSESVYTLKPDAPHDAVDQLSKNLVVPLLEKLLADGTLLEYEIDTLAVHTEAPGTFYIVYIVKNAEDLDKVDSAIRADIHSNPLGGVAFTSMEKVGAHRDFLAHTVATYK
ncbi:MAG: hypothetical protein WBR26_05075 [Candidatus Acidiferrum sp.]